MDPAKPLLQVKLAATDGRYGTANQLQELGPGVDFSTSARAIRPDSRWSRNPETGRSA